MLKRAIFLFFTAASAIALSAQVAFAHKTSVFAHVHGKEIRGEVFADGDMPLGEAKITAYDPMGLILGETVADAEGQFTLTVTRRCDWNIVASGGGHMASYTVPMNELPSDLPSEATAAHNHSHDDLHILRGVPLEDPPAGDADLQDQVVALRQDIKKLREKLRWQDIIGGVGYILGLMGVTFYFLGSRRGERFPSNRND